MCLILCMNVSGVCVCVVSYSSKVLRNYLNRLMIVENIQHSVKKKMNLISTEFQDKITNRETFPMSFQHLTHIS